MRITPSTKQLLVSSVLAFLCAVLGFAPWSAPAALINVNIYYTGFSPSAVTINVNDSVKWTWADSYYHSSTSTHSPPLWDSGLTLGVGHTYTNKFTAAGTFGYWCSYHYFTGSVTVQGANVPPTAAINSPANNAIFAAPWTGTVTAAVADSDGTVTNVSFFAGATLLGKVANPPPNPSLTVSNLAAGNYMLTAVATDNSGASTTSAAVSVSVVTPVSIAISSPQRTSATAFQFAYSANPGLRYVVFRSDTLTNFTPIATNTASASPVTFTDSNATGAQLFYRVQRQSNP
jgi:plastocyanin